jgi:hypothetical protein
MNPSIARSVPRSAAALLPLLLAVAVAPAQGPINLGDLVVVRVGDGSAALTSGSTAVFLDEFTPTGAAVQTLPLPTTASGSNNPFTNSGTATSEGFLTLAGDGQSLVCAGYAMAPGTAAIAGTASTAVARAVARIALSGSIDTSTTLGTAFSAGNPRSVATPDGVQFFVAGSNSGAQYVILSTATPVQLNSAVPTNLRVANVFNGQLYVTSATGSFQGVGTIGTGLPTTSGQTPTLLPGFPTATGPSNYDYYFANANTLYVADDRTGAAGGGIQKWTFAAGTWSLQYTLAPTATSGCRGLTGSNLGGVVTLYATTTQTSANQLVTVIDGGVGSPFVTLATAAANTVFRGVRRIARPGLATVAGVGSPSSGGVATIAATTPPVIGDPTFGVTANNFPVFGVGALVVSYFPLIPGVQIPGAQPGALAYVATLDQVLITFADGAGSALQTIPIPFDNALVGMVAGTQWVVLDGTLPFPLQFATSPGMQLTVGN